MKTGIEAGRKDDQGQQGQPRLLGDLVDGEGDQRHRVLDDRDQRIGQGAVQRDDVVGEARHQFAGAGAAVEAEGEVAAGGSAACRGSQ